MSAQIIYIPQSPAEKQYYDFLWSVVNGNNQLNGGEVLTSLEAFQLLKRSSVDRGFLKQIWSLSTPGSTMNVNQFFAALRFITMIQNGEIPLSKGTFFELSFGYLVVFDSSISCHTFICKERLNQTAKENLGLPKFNGIEIPGMSL
jgi:hypothetical protein